MTKVLSDVRMRVHMLITSHISHPPTPPPHLVMAVAASAVGFTPQSLFVPRLKKTYELTVVEKLMEKSVERQAN